MSDIAAVGKLGGGGDRVGGEVRAGSNGLDSDLRSGGEILRQDDRVDRVIVLGCLLLVCSYSHVCPQASTSAILVRKPILM